MPKTEFLQIRVSPADKRRIEKAARAQYLDASTWARQVILRELDRWESEQEEVEEEGGQG